jgi:hypothetical protein
VVEASTSALGRPPEPPECAAGVETVHERFGAVGQRFDPEAVLGVETEGDRATVRLGAPFAYQTVPLVAVDGEWRLADLYRPWTVRDAPASDPPEPPEFALRAQAVCGNVSRRATPVSARVLSAANPQPSELAGPLRSLARLDRELADRLAGLTPPAGAAPKLEPVIGWVRRVAGAREDLAAALEAGHERKARRLDARFDPYRGRLTAAVRAAGLGPALRACLA